LLALALELLDAPGEYYVNASSGDLFFLPPYPLQPDTRLTVSVLPTLLMANGVNHTALHNLTLSYARGDGVLFPSEKRHNVTPVTHGTRRTFVVELWEGAPNLHSRHQ
jgi:hypothetical protein